MGLPSKRRTGSSKRRRASHFALLKRELTACTNCKKPVLPHHVCLNCGMYDGRQVLKVKSKAEKKLRKREKAAKENAEQPAA